MLACMSAMVAAIADRACGCSDSFESSSRRPRAIRTQERASANAVFASTLNTIVGPIGGFDGELKMRVIARRVGTGLDFERKRPEHPRTMSRRCCMEIVSGLMALAVVGAATPARAARPRIAVLGVTAER